MPSLIQSNFTGGEFAPEFYGDTDQPLYKHGLRGARNYVVLPQGGATKRPGTRRVALAKNGTAQPVVLRRFSPFATISFVLEFGPGYIRFFRNRAAILSGGVPFEVTTPYAAGDLAGLTFSPIGQQLYIWCNLNPPEVLTWSGTDTGFALAVANFSDGPYLAQLGAKLTPSAISGDQTSATLTASAITGINGGAGFRSDDVGRLIRVLQPTIGLTGFGAIAAPGTNYQVGDTITPNGGNFIRAGKWTVTAIGAGGAVTGIANTDAGQYLIAPSSPAGQSATSGRGTGFSLNFTATQTEDAVWTWGIITSRTSPTVIAVVLQAMVIDALGTTAAGIFIGSVALDGRLGAWCSYEGYPLTGGPLFQGRLLVASNQQGSRSLWGSETGRPTSMAPSLATGQVIDTNAINYTLDDEQNDGAMWMSAAGNAQQPQIGIGTGNTEFIIQPPSGNALSPTNVQAWRETNYGAAPIQPVRIGKALLFVDGSTRRLRRWLYRWVAGGMIGPEASPFGRHLLQSGLKQIDYAKTPHQIVWAVTNDGQLIGLTYVADADDINGAVQVAAWHHHPLGGQFYGAPPLVHSMCVSHAADLSYDEVWMAVDRAIPGGAPIRTIEVSTPYFRNQPLDQAVFLDSAISSALTQPAAQCTLTPAPPLADGTIPLPKRGDTQTVTFNADVALVDDTVSGSVLRVNGGTFLLLSIEGPRNITTECIDPPANLAPASSGTWSYTRMKTSFTGFDAFNGLTVTVVGDGALYGPQLVSSGTIVISPAASFVTAGYNYNARLETLDLDLPAQDGTSQMKQGRIETLYLRFFETVGGRYGPADDNFDAIEPRDDDDLVNWAPALTSDDVRLDMPGGSSMHRRVVVEQPDPWPMTLLALVIKGGTSEQQPR